MRIGHFSANATDRPEYSLLRAGVPDPLASAFSDALDAARRAEPSCQKGGNRGEKTRKNASSGAELAGFSRGPSAITIDAIAPNPRRSAGTQRDYKILRRQ
jgi:hypothetical protein